MQALDPLTFPLHGKRLIEASAGTGKTYTIAALYVRLLLDGPYSVDQILVVTFTKAATAELRHRIGQRLREALAAFGTGSCDDPFLAGLLQKHGDHPAMAVYLQDMLQLMDTAAVFTIHGFCQRMLREHAFESGLPFEPELLEDPQRLEKAIVEDFWRQQFYPAPMDELVFVDHFWKGPQTLRQGLQPLLVNENPLVVPRVERERIDALKTEFYQGLQKLRRDWPAARSEIETLLQEHPDLKRSQRDYASANVTDALETVDAWVAEKETVRPLPDKFRFFTADRIRAALRKKRTTSAPQHPLFEFCGDLWETQTNLLKEFKIYLLIKAADFCRDALQHHKSERGELSFDDLLNFLWRGLSRPETGPGLGQRIREKYPVALIDEFQDTDPTQYNIFSSIYAGHSDHGLFMIGDPKQAIYKFRGADIFTYIRARRDTRAAEDRFTLGTNWRSGRALIAAINALFNGAKAPFVYDDDIPFQTVKPGGKVDAAALEVADDSAAGLWIWFLKRTDENRYGKVIRKEWAQKTLPRICAAEIARLLHEAAAGRARLEGRPLAAGDMAVLVRDRFEAKTIKTALSELHINSVYYSRDSVFESEEAEELERILSAANEPENDRLVRAALSTRILAMKAHELDVPAEGDLPWEKGLERFHEYRRLWTSRGFMAMFRLLLRQWQVPRCILAVTGGERRLTNLLHLSELLQEAGREQHGPEGLIRWLRRRRGEADGNLENQQLRLESDASLVKIVTIHKSKGLEYPVVFLPFLWKSKPIDEKKPFSFHDPRRDYRLVMDLGSMQADHYRWAERERLAEELRLAYVALTRAKYRCYLAFGGFRDNQHSALGHLINGADPPNPAPAALDDEALRSRLAFLAENVPQAIRVLDPPDLQQARLSQQKPAVETLAARHFKGRVDQYWRMTSYSALASGGMDVREMPDYDAEADPEIQPKPATDIHDAFHFPKGARAGVFLHGLLEQLDFPNASGQVLRDEINRQLLRYGFSLEWATCLEHWSECILDTPLNAENSLRLREIARSSRLDELEFSYPIAHLDAQGLNRVMDQLTPPAAGGAVEAPRPLSFSPLQGMMKGFIDLIFEWQGRFYLADYKSNYLGPRPRDYGPESLSRAMAEHRYDLQYMVYALALHRYLKWRLPDYTYATHFGGAYYLFLRGMSPEDGHRYGVFFHKPDDDRVQALDQLFAGTNGEVS